MNGRWFEEELLLRYDECSLNIYSSNSSDPLESSNDRDVPHEHTGKKETQKYLRKSRYHRIKCTAAIFLVVFMWRKLLNNAALTTTTHRKSEGVSDGTGTQVGAQMINKCKTKMTQRELYNVRDLP